MQSLDERDTPITDKELELPKIKTALNNLQGHILASHGREHSVHIFLRFLPHREEAAKEWIAKLARESITSAQKQLDEAKEHKKHNASDKVFCTFFLSARGYKALGIPNLPEDKAFRDGMSARRVLAGSDFPLNDPPLGEWDKKYQSKIHAMLLLAAKDQNALQDAKQSCMKGVEEFASVCATEDGRVRKNADKKSIEHFGYVDGVSQPRFFENGCVKNNMEKSRPDRWDPRAGPNLVLVKDPNGDPLKTGFPAYGSYLVFRKLEQDVDGFNRALADLACSLNLENHEQQRAEALVMGRFRNGTPLVLRDTPGKAAPVPNDFTFISDPQGLKCPFHAHIRKMNPRGESDRVVQSALAATLKRLSVAGQEEYDSVQSALGAEYTERSHRIARRSVLYGIHKKEGEEDPRLTPTPEVGVLFMCYQKDIRRQFEFLQANWSNNKNAPAQGTAPDALIGRLSGDQEAIAQPWPRRWNGLRKEHRNFSFGSFVTLTGGEYFFAPSISFLRNITAFPPSTASGPEV